MATIDLSQLPAPDLVDEYTDEDMTTIAALAIWLEFPGSGIPQPGDPLYAAAVMIAKRVNALRSRINDGARSVFLSSATGGSIDQLGALVDERRLTVDPSSNPPTLEDDETFRRATHAAPQAFGTGSQYRYERAVLAADDRIQSVYAAVPAPAELVVEWLPRDDVDPGEFAEIETAITRAIVSNDADGFEYKMLTDTFSVSVADVAVANVDADLYIDPAYDQEEVIAAATAALYAVEPTIKQVRAPVPVSLIYAALDVDGVHSVYLRTPGGDVPSFPLTAFRWDIITLVPKVATWR